MIVRYPCSESEFPLVPPNTEPRCGVLQSVVMRCSDGAVRVLQ